MNPWLGVLATLALLGLNALFVGAEFALISARRTQLEPRVAAGSTPARMTLRALEEVTVVMAAAQLGITVCSLGLGSVGEPAVAHLLEPVFELLAVPGGLVHAISFVLAMSVVAYLHVVLAEMVPKNLALVGPDRAALVLGPFMVVVVAVLRPFVLGLNSIANLAVRLMRIQPRDDVASAYSHDEVAGLVEESRREGLLDEEEYGLVSGALEFHGGTADRVVIPLGSVTTVPYGASAADIEQACATTGFSRFPVSNGPESPDGIGDVVGYLHIKDVLESNGSPQIADKRIRPLATVSRSTRLHDALRAMQSRGAHMARVADADGSVVGVIMLEDVLEELVGEIRDSGR